MLTKLSSSGIADRIRPCIGYAAFCRAIPDCSRAALAGSLRTALGKVADVVDIWDASGGQVAACDAVLAMDCARLVPGPYFIYLCSEQGNVPQADPAVYKRAVGLFAENDRLARSLAEGAGIPRDKIHVIAPAVAAYQGSPRYVREAPRRRLLLCASGYEAQRADLDVVRMALDALDLLRRKYDPEISLTISGLENWTEVGSTLAGVSFRDAPAGAEMMALFDSHDLLVVPPGFDSAGLPEALSQGVPCVAARTSEMSEAITPDVTGAIVDGNEIELTAAIASVLADDGIYRNCYERAPAMAAYFSWERVARQVAQVISREVGLIAW